MHIAVIIDGILAVILLGFVLWGLRRGLLLSLAGLLVFVLSLAGAYFLADALTDPATEAARPVVERFISSRVSAALQGAVSDAVTPEVPSAGGEDPPETASQPQDMGIPEDLSVLEQAERILTALGLGDRVGGDLLQKIEDTVRETSVSVLSAVTQNLLRSVMHTVLFLLSFLVLSLLLRLVTRILNLAMKLPGLNLLNALGGAVVGLAQGMLLLFLLFWALDRFGVRFSAQTIGDTWILQFFVTNGPLGFLSSL